MLVTRPFSSVKFKMKKYKHPEMLTDNCWIDQLISPQSHSSKCATS